MTGLEFSRLFSRHYLEICSLFESRGLKGVTAGQSHLSKSHENLSQLYIEAYEAYRYSYISGRGTLISASSLPNHIGSKPVANTNLLGEVLRNLSICSIEQNLTKLEVNHQYLHIKHVEDIEQSFFVYYEQLKSFARQNNFSSTVIDKLEDFHILNSHKTDIATLNKWLKESLITLSESLGSSSESLRKCKMYIEENLKNVSLTSAATELGMSTGHLSRLFSKEEGMSFTDYLTHRRIEHSILYMRNSQMKIYEIANEVGYPNPEHFSRTFKRIVGKTPKKFLDNE